MLVSRENFFSQKKKNQLCSNILCVTFPLQQAEIKFLPY